MTHQQLLELLNVGKTINCFITVSGVEYDGLPLILTEEHIIFADAAYALYDTFGEEEVHFMLDCVWYMLNEGHESRYFWPAEEGSPSFGFECKLEEETN